MEAERSWEEEVEEVAATLAPEERQALEEWARSAPPSHRGREALLDHVASRRFLRAAEAEGARYIPQSRTLALGEAEVSARLNGHEVRRMVALSPAPLLRSAWNEVREATGESGLRRAREIVEALRARAVAEAQEKFAGVVERVESFAATLPEETRAGALEEAQEKLANPTASLRKLEKQFRRTALRESVAARAAELARLAPEIRVVDVTGAVRFEEEREVELETGGEVFPVMLVATRFGVELERLFLTGSLEDFVAAVRPQLDAELDRLEGAARETTRRIDRFVEERREKPFYDLRALRKIVRDEILRENLGATDDVIAVIRERARRLDFEAREREYVRQMVREEHLVVYKDYFPRARAMERQLVLFVGPTNSGKTWHALNALAAAESGVYLAPLRLLALEGQEEIINRGKDASFITGEERDIREGARFVASTIEMLNPSETYDAAVIDEVQLLTDRDRGWAWCQALVGVAARRVYMTGSLDCMRLVQAMAEYLDEPLEIVPLERFTPLEAIPEPVSLRQVEPGTAVIAFSRRDVLALKAQLERRYRVAVIYGNLTPEVRREEARRFRSGEAQVLVATDAIAMGLNLPIRTVLFSTLRKFNGREDAPLTPAEILQIGGRAGRYGKYEEGYVGALRDEDVLRIAKVLAQGYALPERPLETWVRPAADHVELIAAGLETESLERTLFTFLRGMTFDPPMLQPGVTDDMVKLAAITDHYPEIPIAERLGLSVAPIDTKSEAMLGSYAEWIDDFARGQTVHLGKLPPWFRKERVESDQELQSAEIEAKRLTAYAWLAYRYPEVFRDLETCQEQRAELDRFIERGLSRRPTVRFCRECGRRLPFGSSHTTCKYCHRRRGGRGVGRGH